MSKVRLIRIKYGMSYVKPKIWLSRVEDNHYSLKLGCDCAVSYISSRVVEAVKKRGKKKQVSQNINDQDLVFGKVL